MKRDVAPQVRQKFGKAHCLHSRKTGVEAAGGERLGLGQRARLDHLNEPRIACGIKSVSRRSEQNCSEMIRRLRFCQSLPSPDGRSGGPHHFKGADEPLLVAWEEPLRAFWVELREPLSERDTAQPSMQLDRVLPDFRRNFRHRRQSLLDRTQVKASAANEDRQAASLCRRGNLAERECAPPGDRTALGGVEEAVQPVGRSRFNRLVGPRRQYPKIVIALQAVGVDDRAAQCSGQFERERRFSTGRRSGDDEDRRHPAPASASALVGGPTSGVGGQAMRMVLTLIAGVRGRQSLACLADAVAGTVGNAGEPVWLADDACDLVFDATDSAPAEAAARAVIGGAEVDVLAQPAANRRKRLLVADMESTIIENEMLDELAEFIGRRQEVAEITRRAMNGEVDFAAALEERVGLLAGLPDQVLEETGRRIRIRAGARQLIATMRSAGAVTTLVSSGFMIFAEGVAAELGFDHVIANRLDLTAGRIAGTVSPPIVTGDTKRQTLLAMAAQHRIPLQQSMAIGDGANDLPMLAAAGIGIAFHAKPIVAANARWRLDHADLTGLLYAQGYRRDEIVGRSPAN